MRRLRDVAQARAQERVRPVRADLQREPVRRGSPGARERVGIEAHRQAVVRPLVPRAIGVGAGRTTTPRRCRGTAVADRDVGSRTGVTVDQATWLRRVVLIPALGDSQDGLGHPATGALPRTAPGGTLSCIHARQIGSSMIPASMPSASGPTSAGTPGTRCGGRAWRNGDTGAPTARSGPCAARRGAGWRWNSRPPSRRRRTPAWIAAKSSHTEPCAIAGRGAGGAATSPPAARCARGGSAPQLAPAPPTIAGSGGREE